MDTTHSTPEQPEGPQPGPDLPESQPSSGPDGHHPGPGTPEPPPASGKFFQWVRGLGVRRAPNRWMGGVCSGLADRWGIDPVIIRGLTVVLTLFFGVGLLVYGVAWALLPEPDGRIHAQEAGRGHWSTGMSGAVALAILGLLGQGPGFVWGRDDSWFPWPLFWIAGIAAIIYWAATRKKSKPSAPSPYAGPAQAPWQEPPLAYPSTGYVTPDPRTYVKRKPVKVTPRLGAAASLLAMGLAVVVGAVVLILDSANILDLEGYQVATAAAAAAITVGLAIVAAGARGRAAGGVGTFAVVMLVLAGLLSIPPYSGQLTALNNINWAPASVSSAEAGRSMVFGDATLDLTQFTAAALTTDVQVPVNVVASSVTIKVPKDIPVRLKTELAASNLIVDGATKDGSLAATSTTDLNPQAKGHRLVITLQGAASDIAVVSAASAVPVGATP
ncbi:PspC domain-containing protein [Arthrobacter sp. H35-D1]|uniref:PspC domain-containing protein n=1 Tax=Arthrobacter sp. H35-D1 TaxID=3046202 RepID=UPI0024B91A88|nr:PspC domain-containing protein [Arthrobacter sp. H35-D1]MDJ0312895.1 PspC domain-containing protein [Arthrobacter sp. H35-D1]